MEVLIIKERLFTIRKCYANKQSNVTVRRLCCSEFGKKGMLSEVIIAWEVITLKIRSDFEVIKWLMI